MLTFVKDTDMFFQMTLAESACGKRENPRAFAKVEKLTRAVGQEVPPRHHGIIN